MDQILAHWGDLLTPLRGRASAALRGSFVTRVDRSKVLPRELARLLLRGQRRPLRHVKRRDSMNHSIVQPAVSSAPRQEMFSAPPEAMASFWSRTSLLKEVWDLLQIVGAWPGVVIAPDHNGLRLTLRGVILGYLRWNGRIDLPFGPEAADQLVSEKIASRDLDTDRVVFDIRTAADVNRAVSLLRLAYLIVDSKMDGRANTVAQPPGARG